jgi:type IV secretion system protein VirB10
MAETPNANAPITDHRQAPRGVLPRSAQTWLMVGIAVVMLGIIFIAGRPQAPSDTRPATTLQPPAPNPDRVREYQERLRVLDERATHEAIQAPATAPPTPPTLQYQDAQQPAPPEDPIAADRRRREYESLFAANVVLSRRPGADTPSGTSRPAASRTASTPDSAPSIDDIADAVVRATTRAGAALATASGGAVQQDQAGQSTAAPAATTKPTELPRATIGQLHRLLEGTILDTVLTNRLDGGVAAPVNCLVTNPIYSMDRQHVLIPAGARILGETKPVQGFGEARLAVAFHRLVMPDGASYPLDDFIGVNQIGDAGLRDRVNHHYWSTFGAAGAVGLISGLAQSLSGLGFGSGDGDRTLVIAGSASDATAQASLQVMNRFLNRLPTITIREGHRVKVYLTSDLELPSYERAVRMSSEGGL